MKLRYLVLNKAADEWKRPPREWAEAKTEQPASPNRSSGVDTPDSNSSNTSGLISRVISQSLPFQNETCHRWNSPGSTSCGVADITYIHLAEEFAYLAIILDAFSRMCIGGRWRRTCVPSWRQTRSTWRSRRGGRRRAV